MSDTITQADERASFAVYEAISTTLNDYIEGARTGSSALMRKAFLESAHIQGSFGGKAVDRSLEEFCKLIDERGPASDVKARVVSIEHSGGAAMARLDAENWWGIRFTDFFVLLRQGEEWRIASKVFFAHAKA